jgi:hypothetical protein
MNSNPKELVSMLVCFFEYQYIGALLRNTIKPVWDLLLVVSVAWSESTNAHIVMLTPLGSHKFAGISSVESA